MLGALERLLLNEYVISKKRTKLLESQIQETIMTDLLELPSGSTIETAKTDDETSSLVKDYNEFKEGQWQNSQVINIIHGSCLADLKCYTSCKVQ